MIRDGAMFIMGVGAGLLIVQFLRRLFLGGHTLPSRPTPKAGHNAEAGARVVPSEGHQFPTTQPSHDARVIHSTSASSPADTEAARGGEIIHDDTAAS